MNFSIPGLTGYFGGKGASGVPQQIINIIPPHQTLIVPFLGHCAILRTIKPATTTLGFEIDKSVYDLWIEHFKTNKGFTHGYDNGTYNVFLGENGYAFDNICGIDFIEARNREEGYKWLPKAYKNCVYYCDPPYLHETRLSDTRYTHEMTKEDHERFLSAVIKINAPVLVSHYKNEMYDSHLKGWNTINFMSQTRSGKPRKETVYFNYDKPKELHDYSFYGNNYKSREHNKLKAARLVAKFERMKPLEKNYYLNALAENGVISHP